MQIQPQLVNEYVPHLEEAHSPTNKKPLLKKDPAEAKLFQQRK